MRGQKFAYKKMQKLVDAEFTTTKQTERPKKFLLRNCDISF